MAEATSSSSNSSVYKSSAEASTRYEASMWSSVYNGSEEYTEEYLCDPCNNVKNHEIAEGYCTVCEEYLCRACFRTHLRGKVTRNHTLKSKSDMPLKTFKFCDPCKSAGDEVEVEGYCGDCEEYLCSTCYGSHSRSKATKHHALLVKDKMPEDSSSAIASSAGNPSVTTDEGNKNETFSYFHDIYVKSKRDKEDCYITDMTLLSITTLVLADYNNKSVKVVDTESDEIKGSLDLSSKPLALTALGDGKFAVVLPNECKIKVVQMSTSAKLSVIKTLKTKGLCLGIKYINNKLYISFERPVKFKVVQLTGDYVKKIKKIKPNADVLAFCSLPTEIEVSPDETRIYVSDTKTRKVFCIDMGGNLVHVCQNEFNEPCSIMFSPFGSIYLTERRHKKVYKMSPSLTDVVVMLESRNGLYAPQAMTFNAYTQELYISSGDTAPKFRNFIKVFEII